MSSKIEIIRELLKNFCNEVLNNQEYAQICLKLLSQLEEHPDKPLARGKENIWAAGIMHAVGSINFLFHPASDPNTSFKQLNQYFKTNSNTIKNKSTRLQDLLGITPYNHLFLLRKGQTENPIDKVKEVIIKKFGVSESDINELLKHVAHPDCPIIPKSDYSAITIVPKQKFWNWVATQTNLEDISPSMKTDYNVYLVPDIELESSLVMELHEHFKEIFKIELTRYINVDTDFPEISFVDFLQWFDIRSSSHVMDLTGELLDDFDDENPFDENIEPEDKNKPPGFTLN
ncbi:DUF6398 domain-containing protein [Ancylomarina sp. DW003]|nr:DUF6398 domain-containing protein [Ancylomarina sp. DW003]MDE5422877.1 DUF6398 domain-containing protein [Ancylomarina sp. DW003]